jgi:hypothetical protein
MGSQRPDGNNYEGESKDTEGKKKSPRRSETARAFAGEERGAGAFAGYFFLVALDF